MMPIVWFVAAIGLLLGFLNLVVEVPVPLISYLQIVGGFFVVVAGFLVPLLLLLDGKKLKEHGFHQWLLFILLLGSGGVLFYRGIDRTELKNAVRAIELNNMEQVKRAMDAYQSAYPTLPVGEAKDEKPESEAKEETPIP
jgi:hypothetical protein